MTQTQGFVFISYKISLKVHSFRLLVEAHGHQHLRLHPAFCPTIFRHGHFKVQHSCWRSSRHRQMLGNLSSGERAKGHILSTYPLSENHSRKTHSALPLLSHWSEYSHMTFPNYKAGQEMGCFSRVPLNETRMLFLWKTRRMGSR